MTAPRVVLALFAAMAVAADWPHVRGPAYDAHSAETGLAARWPEVGPPVLWTRELGPGYSAFIVADGKAFTLYQTAAGMFLIALNADSGEEIWKVVRPAQAALDAKDAEEARRTAEATRSS